MIIRRQNILPVSPIPSLFFRERERPGFWGKLWGRIKRNAITIFSTIGTVLGGPIGGSLGALIGSWIQQNQDLDVSINGAPLKTVENQVDEYPISSVEEITLIKWLNDKFFPTVKSIALTLDQELNFSQNRMANTIFTLNIVTPIQRVNKALKEISILKNYALVITEHGERVNRFSSVKRSDNYVINKTEAIFGFLDQIEKGVFKYMIDNNISGYTLVSKDELISSISSVRSVGIDWQGQQVVGSVKKYLKNDELDQDTTPVDVVNIDINDIGTPSTTTGEEYAVTKPKNDFIKKTAIGFAIGYGISLILGDKK